MKVYAYSRETAKKEQKKGKRVWISVYKGPLRSIFFWRFYHVHIM